MESLKDTLADGWLKWEGERCPVPFGTLIDIIHRDGEEFHSEVALGYGNNSNPVNWVSADGTEGDIVAWRLSETNKEKEIEVVNNDWIDRTSDLCPVADNVLIDVILRNGYVATSVLSDEMRIWSIEGEGHDIVGWKLSEKDAITPAEPLSEAPLQVVDKPVEYLIDNVNNPTHYTSHKSGVECIDVTRHMSFNLGNATKYIWRCDLKKDAIEDLRKAIFYLNDEIEMRLKAQKGTA